MTLTVLKLFDFNDNLFITLKAKFNKVVFIFKINFIITINILLSVDNIDAVNMENVLLIRFY